ncbi:MAG TPA: hypothetical protein PKC30_16430 [Saprospiraceae bacterium]|nr:hypothetical protein [Saprospiraceae bacterium]
MKSILKILGIYGKDHTIVQKSPSDQSLSTSATLVPEELFIDNIPPNTPHKLQQENSALLNFLHNHHYEKGLQEGFEYHTADILETSKKKIRSDFQLLLDQNIEEKVNLKMKARMMLIEINDVSRETTQHLELVIAELSTSIENLQKQKELCVENEGWVMTAIHDYHKGYTQGVKDYIDGLQLFNDIQNFHLQKN